MIGTTPWLRDVAITAGYALPTYVALVAAAHLLGRIRGVRFGPLYHAFALAAGLLVGAHLAHWSEPVREILVRHLTAATVVLATIPIIALLNRALWGITEQEEDSAETPRVLAELTGVIVVTIALLATLQFIYAVQVPGLLAGSGVVALILGLGMQDQLHNLFAGVSLHFGKPFKCGDWILLDGQHAKVVQISWRGTRLLTSDEVMIEVGNSELLKKPVTNFHAPYQRHAVRATIGLDYAAAPARVQTILQQAAKTVPGVCATPEPAVYVKDFADSAVVYEIKVWIEDHGTMSRVLSDVRSHCWYAVKRAGIEIPFPQLTLRRAKREDTGAGTREAAIHALRSTLLGFLSTEQLTELVRESTVVAYAPTERIIEQDAPGASLFLLIRGQVEVRLRRGDRVTVVAKLGPGECFGEMSLLAGEPRSATVVALSEVEAVEIQKPAFAALVHDTPDVLGRLSELLAQRQLANAQQAAAGDRVQQAEQVRNRMLARLRAFFELRS